MRVLRRVRLSRVPGRGAPAAATTVGAEVSSAASAIDASRKPSKQSAPRGPVPPRHASHPPLYHQPARAVPGIAPPAHPRLSSRPGAATAPPQALRPRRARPASHRRPQNDCVGRCRVAGVDRPSSTVAATCVPRSAHRLRRCPAAARIVSRLVGADHRALPRKRSRELLSSSGSPNRRTLTSGGQFS
jgi:hypothetical protein